MYNFAIRKVYTFNTLAPSLLGVTIKNATMVGMTDYSTAKLSENIDLKFRQIYPLLPPGTPNIPEACTYWHFISESGEKIILANIWIDETTVEIVEHVNLKIILNEASLKDIQRIRDAMNALGYINYTITQF